MTSETNRIECKHHQLVEDLEKEANHIPEDEHLESRMMYLDLLGYIR